VTRVARATTGLVAGLLVLAVGVFVAAWFGWLLAGGLLAGAGFAAVVGFMLAYDVDPPDEAGVP
jgi:hypothetical protein